MAPEVLIHQDFFSPYFNPFWIPPAIPPNLPLLETPQLAVQMAQNWVTEEPNTSPCPPQLCLEDSEEGVWLSIPHLAQVGGEGIISVKKVKWIKLVQTVHQQENVCLGGSTKVKGHVLWSGDGIPCICNTLVVE